MDQAPLVPEQLDTVVWLLGLQVVDIERALLWFRSEATLDALLHPGHQDATAEALPTLP